MKKLFVYAATCLMLGSAAMAYAAEEPAATKPVGNAEAGKQKAAVCAACHGADGNSVNPEWPKLAGQHASYLAKELQNFKEPTKEGGRVNAIMNGQVIALKDQDMLDLSAYFSSQALKPGQADAALVAQGEKLYRGGDLAKGISACTACHGPSGAGNAEAKFPALAGQHAKYTELQLQTFRSGQRANDNGQMMRNIAARMSDAEIKAVASYIQGLKP